ncbi:MAG: hypothetical protein Q9157_004215 [Trypethelium eluteriae]
MTQKLEQGARVSRAAPLKKLVGKFTDTNAGSVIPQNDGFASHSSTSGLGPNGPVGSRLVRKVDLSQDSLSKKSIPRRRSPTARATSGIRNVSEGGSPRGARQDRATKAAVVRHDNNPNPNPNPNPSPSPNSGKSLLEALFPEAADPKSTSKPERHIPRLPIEPVRPPSIESTIPKGKNDPLPVLKDRRRQTRENQEEVVLRFYGSSKYLLESDFRRVSPGGRHIEGWQQDLGRIERIIPGRNPSTLERDESYCLVFSSLASAEAYRTEVIRLHQLSTTHTPTSLISMIPPPPGFPIDGEDAHAKMQSYALYPPSVNPDIRLEDQPFREWTASEAVRGDANQLMRRPIKRGHEVLLHVNGPQPTVYDVRGAISKDGVNRALPWATLPGPDAGVTELKLAISMHGELHQQLLDKQWLEGREEEVKTNIHAKVFHKWIVAFQTEVEAKRFVRAWHKMPLPAWWQGTQYEEVPSIVHAELLWGDT